MKRNIILLILFTLSIFAIPASSFAQDAQEPVTVGILLYDAPSLINAMTELGYVEGEDVNYIVLSFEGIPPEQWAEQTAIQTQAILDANVDVLVVNTDTDAVMLRDRAGGVPIIFNISDDPIATGAVTDLTTPGGNTTGVVSNSHHERRLQLLTEVNPATDKVYFLYSPLSLEGDTILARVQAVGEELGVEVIPAPTPDLQGGLDALNNIPDGVDWLFLTPYVPFDTEFTEALFAVSTERQIPIAGYFGNPIQGYVIDYGPDFSVVPHQVAGIIDLVLRGANPGDLPILIAENSLVVDLETAEAINMEIPVEILRQADQIMRPGDFENLQPFGSN